MADCAEIYTHISGSAPPANPEPYQALASMRRGRYVADLTEKYHQKLRDGVFLVPKYYTRWDYTEVRSEGSYGGTYTSPTKSYRYDWNPRWSIPGVSNTLKAMKTEFSRMTEDVDINALRISSLADCQPDLDVLTSLAEGHKTLSMVGGVVRDTVDLIRRATRGGYRSAAEAVSDAWLSWRYGWRILGYDVEAIHGFLLRPTVLIQQGLAFENFEESESSSPESIGYFVTHQKATTIERSAGIQVKTYAQFDATTLNNVVNPVQTAWELIPFSFVADWLINVGDVLSAWDVALRATNYYQTLGCRFEERGRAKVTVTGDGSGIYASNPVASGNSTSFGRFKTRLVYGSDHPLSFIPQTNVRLTGPRIADLASLCISAGKGIKPWIRF
jgi:hypothetical protein